MVVKEWLPQAVAATNKAEVWAKHKQNKIWKQRTKVKRRKQKWKSQWPRRRSNKRTPNNINCVSKRTMWMERLLCPPGQILPARPQSLKQWLTLHAPWAAGSTAKYRMGVAGTDFSISQNLENGKRQKKKNKLKNNKIKKKKKIKKNKKTVQQWRAKLRMIRFVLVDDAGMTCNF